VKRRRWKALLPGLILIAVAQLPLLLMRISNADMLALRMAWPVYSVPLTILGLIALAAGLVVLLFLPKAAD